MGTNIRRHLPLDHFPKRDDPRATFSVNGDVVMLRSIKSCIGLGTTAAWLSVSGTALLAQTEVILPIVEQMLLCTIDETPELFVIGNDANAKKVVFGRPGEVFVSNETLTFVEDNAFYQFNAPSVSRMVEGVVTVGMCIEISEELFSIAALLNATAYLDVPKQKFSSSSVLMTDPNGLVDGIRDARIAQDEASAAAMDAAHKAAQEAARVAAADAAEQAERNAAAVAAREARVADALKAAADARRVVGLPESTTVEPLSTAEWGSLVTAIRRCWNVDPGSQAARTTVTLEFELDSRGKVSGQPRLIQASDDGTAGKIAFDIATRAVLRCQGTTGYDLPASKYGQWSKIELTASPQGMSIEAIGGK